MYEPFLNWFGFRFVTRDHPTLSQLEKYEQEGKPVGFRLVWTEVEELLSDGSECLVNWLLNWSSFFFARSTFAVKYSYGGLAPGFGINERHSGAKQSSVKLRRISRRNQKMGASLKSTGNMWEINGVRRRQICLFAYFCTLILQKCFVTACIYMNARISICLSGSPKLEITQTT